MSAYTGAAYIHPATHTTCYSIQHPGAYFLSNSIVKRQKSIYHMYACFTCTRMHDIMYVTLQEASIANKVGIHQHI